MLPGLSGMELCKILRERSETERLPVLMLTAKAGEADRVVGLEMGADDYLTKPFSPRELVARVRAILRRVESAKPADHVAGLRQRLSKNRFQHLRSVRPWKEHQADLKRI